MHRNACAPRKSGSRAEAHNRMGPARARLFSRMRATQRKSQSMAIRHRARRDVSRFAPRECATASRSRFSRLRSEEHTSELQSHLNLVCRLLLEKKKTSNTG